MAMNIGSFASRVVATKVVATDGTGDFTDIQEAIDALPAGGGVVYIKEGTYTITSTILINSDNIELHGAGASTIIKRDTGLSGSVIDIGDENTVVKNVRITDLQIDGDRTSSSSDLYGVQIRGTSDYILENISVINCYIHHTGDSGSHMNYVDGAHILNCTISNCYGDGAHIENSSFIITQCFIKSNSEYGIYWSGVYEAPSGRASTVINSNYVYFNGYGGIYLRNCMKASVSNNAIYNNSQSVSGYAGIETTWASNRNIINGNAAFDNQETASQDRGIYINGTANTKNIIISNVCIGNVTAQITNTGTGTVVAHNVTS